MSNPVDIRSRIVGHEDVDPDQLLAHPMNARRHPAKQMNALEGSLGVLGWLKDCIVNVTTGHVLDGHARITAALRSNSKVPVTYVKISEKEELLALATLDKISEMAIYDEDALNALLADVPEPDDAGLKALLDEMAGEQGPRQGGEEAPIPGKFQIVIECEGESQQTQLLDRFLLEGLQCRALI